MSKRGWWVGLACRWCGNRIKTTGNEAVAFHFHTTANLGANTVPADPKTPRFSDDPGGGGASRKFGRVAETRALSISLSVKPSAGG
jgi:hypothetical protein